MSAFETIAIYVIAPALSTVTAGLVAYGGRTFVQLQKVQKTLVYRVEQNEEELEDVKSDLQQIKAIVG